MDRFSVLSFSYFNIILLYFNIIVFAAPSNSMHRAKGLFVYNNKKKKMGEDKKNKLKTLAHLTKKIAPPIGAHSTV